MHSEILIVVPTLGTRENWLHECLQSIQAQDYAKIKIRIVTPARSLKVDTTGPYPIEIVIEEKPGLSTAINTGLIGYSGGFCTWLGDDDLLAPNSVSTCIVELKEHSQAPYVYGRTRYIGADGRSIGVTRPGRLAARWLRYGKDFVPQPGSVIRTASFELAGPLRSDLKNAMDLSLFMELNKIARPRYVPTELSSYRLHENSITLTKGEGDEAESVRRAEHGTFAAATYRYWRPIVSVIDLYWDRYNRRTQIWEKIRRTMAG